MKIPLNIPNILSLYRLVSFPFVLFIGILGYEQLFVILLIINLVTDVLDGIIARAFNMQTEIGARIDSIADFGTYILAIFGVFKYKIDDFNPYLFSFFIFIGLFVFSHVLSLIKFKKMPCLHLFSWKIGGYIQGAFFVILFAYGFNLAFYIFMATWGIISFIEHIVIQLLIKEMKPNAKGLYWVLKNKING